MRDALKELLTAPGQVFRRALFRLHGLLHDTVTIQTRQGRLTIPTGDRVISAQLYRNGQYEFDSSLRTIRFLKRMGFIPRDDLCMLDIGSNIGLITTGLLLAGEIDLSVAVEPEPTNFALLERNVEQNGLERRVLCIRSAVGDRKGTLTMELSSSNTGDHRIRSVPSTSAAERDRESERGTLQVASLPLDDIVSLPRTRDFSKSMSMFLWVDVQGYEGYVFSGGRNFLSKGVAAVSEVWPYGILRAGMRLEEFAEVVADIWSDYWTERDGSFERHRIEDIGRFMDEIGSDGDYENVIFTTGNRELRGDTDDQNSEE
jgi:FkbM family methyltransferase